MNSYRSGCIALERRVSGLAIAFKEIKQANLMDLAVEELMIGPFGISRLELRAMKNMAYLDKRQQAG
jgi:hypothetical protein